MSNKQASGLWQDKNYVNGWKRDWLNRHPELRDRRKRIMRQQRAEFIESLEQAMGGECQRCGYNACFAALDFHHVNSQEKKAQVSSLANGRKWKDAECEADKCVLLCGNCHREYEHGFWIGEFVKRDGLGYTIESWKIVSGHDAITPFMKARYSQSNDDQESEQLPLFSVFV